MNFLRRIKINNLSNNKKIKPSFDNIKLSKRDNSFLNFVKYYNVIICGSFALRLYGLLKRRNKDYDVIITKKQLSHIKKSNLISLDTSYREKNKNLLFVGKINKLNICLFLYKNTKYTYTDIYKIDNIFNILKCKLSILDRKKDKKDLLKIEKLFNELN